MKKTYQRLPESELDIMLVLWNGTPPMTRPEIEKVINTKKKLASTTILSLLTRLESKNFVEVTKQGKMNLYTPLVSQADYQAHESQSVLEKLYGNSLKKFVMGRRSVLKRFRISVSFLRSWRTERNSKLWRFLFCIF